MVQFHTMSLFKRLFNFSIWISSQPQADSTSRVHPRWQASRLVCDEMLAELVVQGDTDALPGHSVRIRRRIQVDILECLRDRPPNMGIVTLIGDLVCIDVHILVTVQVDFNSYVRREIEVRVEGAGAMTLFDTVGGGEFPYIVCAGFGAFETLSDAIAFVLHLREGEVDFRHDACDVEASDN